jgi:SAM-dependent methyltransferase
MQPDRAQRPTFAGVLRRLTPAVQRDVQARSKLARLTSTLEPRSTRVLVLGDSEVDALVAESLAAHGIEPARFDVVSRDAAAPADGAGLLPFDDGGFDAVIARNVLQRVLEPERCVAEMHRILAATGVIYVEMPFMQPVTASALDFQRYTSLGLRRLLRRFEEIESGAASGTGSALAQSWRQFLWSLPRSRNLGFLLAMLGSFTSFFYGLLDRWLIDRPRTLDGAASLCFLGRRSDATLSDRELLAGYRGAVIMAWPDGSAGPRPASEVFTRWAVMGYDEGMRRNHAPAVEEMITAAMAALGEDAVMFTAIDAGCGNGWLVRRLRALPGCSGATGVDGAAGMIAKARSLDPAGDYVLADLLQWQPARVVDLVISMEVIYYVDDPVALLRRMRGEWLRPGGWAAIGVDHYVEHEESLKWPAGVGVRMTTWSEAQWRDALERAGFEAIRLWRAAAGPGVPGTLAMLARAPFK